VPGDEYDLSALRSVLLAGSPVSAQCGAWVYRHVKADLWLATGSGGTGTCCGVGRGGPLLPGSARGSQAPRLGGGVEAFDPAGRGGGDVSDPADAVDAGQLLG